MAPVKAIRVLAAGVPFFAQAAMKSTFTVVPNTPPTIGWK
jgi:hypothetical protein